MAEADSDFTEYVAARYPRLVRAAVLLGAGVDNAEDAVQTALVRCYRSWAAVTRAEDPDAYVYRVLANSLAKGRRRKWWGETPTDAPPDDSVGQPDHASAVAATVTLRHALHQLPYDQRAVLVLRFYADLSEHQTAASLGVPLGTVKSRTARALAALGSSPTVTGLQAHTEENHA